MIVVYIVLGLLVLILLRAASLSNNMHIEKTVNINCSAADVFNEIKMLKNHASFNKWIMKDPNLNIKYTGTDGTPGFSSHWKSEIKDVGEGIQKIVAIEENKKVACHLTFIKPFAGTADTVISIRSTGPSSCDVTWSFSGPQNFMMKIMQVLVNIKKTLGRDTLENLHNLKNKLEKK